MKSNIEKTWIAMNSSQVLDTKSLNKAKKNNPLDLFLPNLVMALGGNWGSPDSAAYVFAVIVVIMVS